MSDVNKLDSKQCTLDPDQFKVKIKSIEYEAIEPKIISVEFNDSVGAPVGTFPWAIIQVYLGNYVRRGIWDANTYIYGNKIGASDQAINQVNKEGTFAWDPEQQDMLACDWGLKSNPVCMLSFDLEVGTSQYSDGQDWGYLTPGGGLSSGEYPFGTLTNLQSTLGIGNILAFASNENPIGTFYFIQLQVDIQNQPDLQSKSLEVAVNGSSYDLGSSYFTGTGSTTTFAYDSDGAKQLGDLLKQNVGKTLSFCFIWK